jgi:choline dehydrogenase-like flavoprotein
MTTRSQRSLGLGMVLLAVVGAGCTRTYEAKYQAGMPRLDQAEQLRGLRLGIATFDDRRATVEASEPQTRGYVAKQGPWRFGMTYKGRNYIPVAELAQAIFVEEFQRAGIEANAIPQVLGKGAAAAMRAAGDQAGTSHVLGGNVNVFEFENHDQFWYIESVRSVVLEIELVRVRDGESVLDTSVAATDRGNEGAISPHSSNVDQLMNRVFRLVVYQVVDKVVAKLAMELGRVDVRVVISNE